MKRVNNLYWIFICSPLFLFMNIVNAQQQVTKGSIHTYSVTAGSDAVDYVYHWSASGGTSSPFGTGDTTNAILWDGLPGLYTLSVFVEQPVTKCLGNNQSFAIRIVGMNIFWSEQSSRQCPSTDNETGTFPITAEYTGIAGNWSFCYRIDDSSSQKVNVSSGSSSTIYIPGFTNESNSTPENHAIRITSVTSPDNYTIQYTGTEPDAASRIYMVTIEPTPGTSGIIQIN